MVEPMAYQGRKSCGCVVAIMVDEPEYVKDTANEIARWIRKGLTIERVDIETARSSFTICPHDKKKR